MFGRGGPIAWVHNPPASGEDVTRAAGVTGECVAEVRKRAARALAGADDVGVRVDPEAVVKGSCVAGRGAAGLALGWGIVTCAAEAVPGPEASCKGGGYDTIMARAESTGLENAGDWFEENASLILRPSELHRETIQRSAVMKLAHGVGRYME